MAVDQNPLSDSADREALQAQVLHLQGQLAEATAKNRAMWTLLAEVCQKLQLSSASIKAAVSSLLDYDIFWDGSAQHEFFETIDDSVDRSSNLIMLMTLAFRSEAGSLELNREAHELQEIVSTVVETISTKTPHLQLKVALPLEGPPVFVDYGYLAVAFRLLLEVCIQAQPNEEEFKVEAVEIENQWHLNIEPVARPIIEVVENLADCQAHNLTLTDQLLPENVLKLFTACRILRLLDVQLKLLPRTEDNSGLGLIVPAIQN